MSKRFKAFLHILAVATSAYSLYGAAIPEPYNHVVATGVTFIQALLHFRDNGGQHA